MIIQDDYESLLSAIKNVIAEHEKSKPRASGFERGDRVKDSLEADIVSIRDTAAIIEFGDGSRDTVPITDLTLITAAQDREIEVGDTFLCTECEEEFVASEVSGGLVYNKDSGTIHAHMKHICTFRYRPKAAKPPRFKAGDVIRYANPGRAKGLWNK